MCSVCGSSGHSLVTCPKHIKEYSAQLFTSICSICGMNHYGSDCPGGTSVSHSDISSVSDIAASVLSGEVSGRATWSFSKSTSDSHILDSDSGEVWQQSFSVADRSDTNKNNCILNDSLCFSRKKKLPNNVLEDSVAFPSKFKTFNPDYY